MKIILGRRILEWGFLISQWETICIFSPWGKSETHLLEPHMLLLITVSVLQNAGTVSEVTRLQQDGLRLFACDSRSLLVVKGEQWGDGAGAKYLGLENLRTWKLLTRTLRPSTKSGLNHSLQETGKLFICPRASPDSRAAPFNPTEHADRHQVIPGNLGPCRSLRGRRCVRMASKVFQTAGGA